MLRNIYWHAFVERVTCFVTRRDITDGLRAADQTGWVEAQCSIHAADGGAGPTGRPGRRRGQPAGAAARRAAAARWHVASRQRPAAARLCAASGAMPRDWRPICIANGVCGAKGGGGAGAPRPAGPRLDSCAAAGTAATAMWRRTPNAPTAPTCRQPLQHLTMPPASPQPLHTRSRPCTARRRQNGLLLLPVTTRRGGKQQQYAWDGRAIKPISTELLGNGYTPAGAAAGAQGGEAVGRGAGRRMLRRPPCRAACRQPPASGPRVPTGPDPSWSSPL